MTSGEIKRSEATCFFGASGTMSRVKLATVTFAVIYSLLTVIPPCYASEELKGTFRVLEQTDSSVKATDIAYPSNNPRDSCTVKLPDGESPLLSAACPTCRPGGQQWLQYEGYLLAVVGSDIIVFSSSGELCVIHQVLPLHNQCSPRELLLAPFGQYPLVLCLASPIPAYQKIHLSNDGTFTHNNRLFWAGSDDAALFPINYTGNGVVVGQYFVYIIENIIEANDIDDGTLFELYWDGSDEKCGTLQELHGRAVDKHLMRLYVTCNKDGTATVFQLLAEDLLIVDETDVPAPRNGEISIHEDFFAIWGEQDVTVYNASNPSSYFHHSYDHTVAGVTFLDQKSRGPFLLVSLYGTTRSLIDVEKGFLDQDGGVYNLPVTSCPATGGCFPHMLIGPDSSYLVVFTPQSNGNNGAQILDLQSANPSDPQSPVEDIFGDPLYLMFYVTPTPSIGHPVTPTPSIGPPTSSPTDPTQSLSTEEIVGIAVAVGIPVVGVVITIVVCCAVSKRKKKGLPPPIQAMEQHPLPRMDPSGQESSTDEGRGQSKPIQESNNRDSITIVHVQIQGEDDTSAYGTDSNPSNSATSSRSNSVSRSVSPADGGTAPSSPVGMKKHPPVNAGLEKSNFLALPTTRT